MQDVAFPIRSAEIQAFGRHNITSCKISIAGIEYLENLVRRDDAPKMRSGEVNFLQIEIEYCGQ